MIILVKNYQTDNFKLSEYLLSDAIFVSIINTYPFKNEILLDNFVLFSFHDNIFSSDATFVKFY